MITIQCDGDGNDGHSDDGDGDSNLKIGT